MKSDKQPAVLPGFAVGEEGEGREVVVTLLMGFAAAGLVGPEAAEVLEMPLLDIEMVIEVLKASPLGALEVWTGTLLLVAAGGLLVTAGAPPLPVQLSTAPLGPTPCTSTGTPAGTLISYGKLTHAPSPYRFKTAALADRMSEATIRPYMIDILKKKSERQRMD